MQVKKYVGENIQDVIWKVKGDLGADAVIIHTRRFKEGAIFGILGGQDKVEVVAAAPKEGELEASIPAEEINEKYFNNLQRQISDLKSFMQSIVNKNDTAGKFSPAVEEIYNGLLENEIEPWLAEKISLLMEKEITSEDLKKKAVTVGILENFLKSFIQIGQPIEAKNGKLVAVVGPTGVGKTTTLAKLTAYFSLMENKNVALITADTYRIAAVEQLKTYGEIMGIPVEAVYTPEELENAIAKYDDKDIILLDTAGRSQKNNQQMEELKEFLQGVEPDETYLVLSATTKYKDLIDMVENFSQVNFDKVIFTKLDETNNYGAVISLLCHLKKPVSYLTVGQNVPDDIKRASHEELFSPLLKRLNT